MERLADIAAARGVQRIVHFHCDHFEPFRKDAGGAPVGLAAVKTLNERRLQLPHLQKLSLFCSSQRYCYADKEKVDPNYIPRMYPMGDLLFDDSSHKGHEEELLQYLDAQPGIDWHVHLHHEWWTSSACTKWEVDPELDAERIAAVIKLHLDHYARNTSIDVSSWGFVHGCWALNGSDRSICNVTNEISVLQSLGCFGDFTFPAGRSWCDPTVKLPHTVLPVDAYMGYDTPPAQARAIGAHAFRPRSFLIWNAQTPSSALSVETIAKQGMAAVPAVVQSWLQTSPVLRGTLYIKTHCHSLWWECWNGAENVTPTLLSDAFSNCFAQLELAGLAVEHKTAREILTEMQELDR